MKRGWFAIPGIQLGERELKERVAPLGMVLDAASGASVIDFGCAEGLIGKWLVDAGGAASLHGIDKHPPYIEIARALTKGYKARFDVTDLDGFEAWRESADLLPRYDIVLALNILQKLRQPAAFLQSIGAICGDVLALSLPARVLLDERSGFVPMDPEAVLRRDFALIEQHDGHFDRKKGHYGMRLIFRRLRRI